VCAPARQRGIPYSRSGPSLFVHGPDILIDTPEEIKDQLNRSSVTQINACFYSHWHPDHTMGRRVWEMNNDWRNWPPHIRQTDIYLPQQVAWDFKRWLGIWDHLTFFAARGWVRLVEVPDGETITIGQTTIRPFRLAENYVYAFLMEESGKRVLIVADELHNWSPSPDVCGVDLAILPMGLVEFDPCTGERRISAEHPLLKEEATFDQTLEIVRQLQAARVILSHIEEPDGLSYDDLQALQQRLQGDGLPISFAFDTMKVDV
jgi:phosphoribosyl 1,2-cyclic phosphate phosphodiesterase